MPKIAYVKQRFKPSSLKTIDQANEIIDEYIERDMKITLRQLYYQMVSRDMLVNTTRSYKNLGGIINDGRMAGLIDWDVIEDRTREVVDPSDWKNPASILEVCSRTFRVDRWEDQPYRPEVWIEKEALAGVISGVCHKLHIPYLSCRGYASQSEMWSSAMRLKAFAENNGQTPIILHFGDHDPSGIDMSRDIFDRLEVFMGGLKIDRLALNMNQIRSFNPPPNPAKVTDPRFETYQQKYGDESWELDALKPEILIGLIEDAVLELRDDEILAEKMKIENFYKAQLKETSDRWPEIEKKILKTRMPK